MKEKKAVFIYSQQLGKYSYPPDCPFNLSRTPRLHKILNSMGLLSGNNISQIAPHKPGREVLEMFHTSRYLDALQNAAKGKFDIEALHMGIGSPDCPVFGDMYKCSVLAAGATLAGAEAILKNEADIAFNPSGGFHHASPEHAAGFCYINDVALACLVLANASKKVLYLDIDVHHGDGVQNLFYNRKDVMTISFHQNGRTLFPGTGFEDEIGIGKGQGYCVNVPLPIDTYDEAYFKAYKQIVPPLLKSYDPDVIVFELGTDTLAGDPLANLKLTNNTYADIIYDLLSFDKPILATGGGGYNIDNTVRAWALAWSVLSGCDRENQHHNIGLGGVMLESTDWFGGLRDRQLAITDQQRQSVTKEIDTTIRAVKKNIFHFHGI
ncbi:MAG: acetoin utilization protein AcuC [Phycisphaerae bacterium]|nr:acetoin utilization protein AcuC [Phycisphaerae bacterium]